jgi:hypothetical protein
LIYEKLDHVAKELEEDMERLEYAGNTITLKLKLDTFEGESLSLLKNARAHTMQFEVGPSRYIKQFEPMMNSWRYVLVLPENWWS